MSDDTAVPMTGHDLQGPADAPTLMLGNSLGTSSAVWDQQVDKFAGAFRLLRYELPGHGGSPAARGPYTIGGLGAGALELSAEAVDDVWSRSGIFGGEPPADDPVGHGRQSRCAHLLSAG